MKAFMSDRAKRFGQGYRPSSVDEAKRILAETEKIREDDLGHMTYRDIAGTILSVTLAEALENFVNS